ncbi:uncharacterized protein LOC132713411 [Ruditapes philippinarum]|uniref:uncharacterized protein LOC132713411 n=1 Tax=Ruditapes philippinarum TaxID=129788 RepID=UPI00295C31AE|nr:uncharacterized protein LOC132713411 [Ruditapes philippinarum]
MATILEEMQTAKHNIMLYVQKTAFSSEINNLQNSKPVKKDSSIASLNPMIYDDLIRVQGRLQSRNQSNCPVILPNKNTVTRMIIRHIHENNGHAGKQHVLAASREKYWILQGPSAVKNIVKNCIICRRQHTPLMTQQMAPLLPEQTTPDEPPFTNVGIDYFGPLIVKAERTHVKRYGCLFTCLATRAVHLEVTHTLTTDSFTAAFQRFTARRGYQKVFSDNGTNLVSGVYLKVHLSHTHVAY